MRNRILIFLMGIVCVVGISNTAWCGCKDVTNPYLEATWPPCTLKSGVELKISNKQELTTPGECASYGLNGATKCTIYCKADTDNCAGKLVAVVNECEKNWHRFKEVENTGGGFESCKNDEEWCGAQGAKTTWTYSRVKDVWYCDCTNSSMEWNNVKGVCEESVDKIQCGKKKGRWEFGTCKHPGPNAECYYWDNGVYEFKTYSCCLDCVNLGQDKAIWDERNHLCVGNHDFYGKHMDKDNKCTWVDGKPATQVPSPQELQLSQVRDTLRGIEGGLQKSHWKDEQGNFNTARLTSDSIAGVVLGTAGGLITSNIIKKNQMAHGMENVGCVIGGQVVAGWGDFFQVGIKNIINKKR